MTGRDYPALAHYAAEANAPTLRYRDQTPLTERRFASPFDKPSGLWVSDDADFGWLDWCVGEGFRLHQLAARWSVVLCAPAQILWLTTSADLDAFTQRYGRLVGDSPLQCPVVDWAAVAADHAGVVVTPYQWTRRLHPPTMWYYGWDAAGGCIWDPAVIARLERDDAHAPPAMMVDRR